MVDLGITTTTVDRHPAPTAATPPSFGEIVYPPNGTLGPRIQRSIQIVVVYRGSMSVWVDDERVDVMANTVCVLLPGHREEFAFAEDTETHHSWAHYGDDGHFEEFLERLLHLPRLIRLSRTLARRMRALLDLEFSVLPTRRELERLLAHLVLLQYIGEAELSGYGPLSPSSPLERALQAIEAQLGSEIDVGEIAASAAVSTSHLIRLFNRHLGVTPARYLWQRRVERGIELLEETGLPIGEVARTCGFRSSHHFSRRVREASGSTPTRVRDQAWAAPLTDG